MSEAMLKEASGLCTVEDGNCGTLLAIPFFLALQLVGSYICLSLAVAVILENFSILGHESPALTTVDDIHDFTEERAHFTSISASTSTRSHCFLQAVYCLLFQWLPGPNPICSVLAQLLAPLNWPLCSSGLGSFRPKWNKRDTEHRSTVLPAGGASSARPQRGINKGCPAEMHQNRHRPTRRNPIS